jgi:hypothetical protein
LYVFSNSFDYLSRGYSWFRPARAFHGEKAFLRGIDIGMRILAASDSGGYAHTAWHLQHHAMIAAGSFASRMIDGARERHPVSPATARDARHAH